MSEPHRILYHQHIVALWHLLGFGQSMAHYESAPGIGVSRESDWPSQSRLPIVRGSFTLVIAAHPQCPCTRATMAELALLLADCHKNLTTYVLFYKPLGFPDGWEKSDIWRSAAAIPGMHIISDSDGRESQLFHAATSGQTILFDSAGHKIFSGGITISRGHSGDNIGLSAITSLMNGGHTTFKNTPVFGCSLLGLHREVGNK